MSPVRRILAPTDYSDNSLAAVRYAAGLAEAFGAELVLLHVVPDLTLVLPDAVMPTPVAGPDLQELAANARAALAKIVAEQGLAKLDTKTEVRIGQAAAEIDAAAKELKADLICLSTHGRTGLAHLFLGSVAERVVRHAPCPVLVVPPPR